MHFTKMHGCGNDYVFVEENELPECDISMLAKQVSDRKKGIGSDGLIGITQMVQLEKCVAMEYAA